MTSRSMILAMAMAFALSACAPNAIEAPANIDPIFLATAPPDAPSGTCWDKTISPAVIETRTQKTLLRSARISADGQIQAAPIYKTKTIHHVVRPRQEYWFQTLCGAQLPPDFIASVQRALQARGHFSGPVTSKMDKRTRVAVRRYQQSKGVNSEALALSTARELGLIAAYGNPLAN